MSRIPREDVWFNSFGKAKAVACQCCKMVAIHADKSKGKHGWHRGHIVPAKEGKPDIVENLEPICLECNINDKSYPTNYHYRVALGTMSLEKCNSKLQQLYSLFDAVHNDSSVMQCLAKNCSFKRKPRSLFCARHRRNSDDHILYYIDSSCTSSINIYVRTLHNMKSIADINDQDDMLEIEIIKSMIGEIRNFQDR